MTPQRATPKPASVSQLAALAAKLAMGNGLRVLAPSTALK